MWLFPAGKPLDAGVLMVRKPLDAGVLMGRKPLDAGVLMGRKPLEAGVLMVVGKLLMWRERVLPGLRRLRGRGV